MSYAAYIKSTRAMAAALSAEGAHIEDLAGGCYGVAVPIDGATLIIARCPDLGYSTQYATWAFSVEDIHGEKHYDLPGADESGYVDLGFIRPRDYSSALPAALAKVGPRS